MLDFYFIPDDTSKPNDGPPVLDFVGDLDPKTFSNLQKKGVIDDRFDYYSDFRWSETLVKQIRQIIESKQMHSDTDVKQLLELLDSAIAKQSGLIAYGD